MDILKQLENAVIMRDLDLTELDAGYVDENGNPLAFRYRVNPTRGQVVLMWSLHNEFGEIQAENKRDQAEEEEKQLVARLRTNTSAWAKWWSTILQVEDDASPWLAEVEGWGRFGRWLAVLLRRFVRAPRRWRYLRPREVRELIDLGPLWEWIQGRVMEAIAAYELETVKKAHGGPTPATSAAPADARQNSTPE